MGSEGDSRIRLVVMGDRKVGKTCLLRQFLFTTFQDKYKPTVEDLYSEDFNFADSKLKVDFLDTAGDDQFPVMRRLSISSGHAFLLVYSVNDPASLELVQTRLEEIRQHRSDFKELPIVLAGNKVDLANDQREIFVEDVMDWAAYSLHTTRIKVLECSAKDSWNVNAVFKAFLELSNICRVSDNLRRGSSAYAKIKFNNQNEPKSLHNRIKSLKLPSRFGSEKRRPKTAAIVQTTPIRSPSSLPGSPPPAFAGSLSSSPLTDSSTSPGKAPASPVFDFSFKKKDKSKTEPTRNEEKKQRSRSLYRRGGSVKMRKKAAGTQPEECTVS